MRSFAWAVVLVAGCSFSGEPGGGVDDPTPDPDASTGGTDASMATKIARIDAWGASEIGGGGATIPDVDIISVDIRGASDQPSRFIAIVSSKPYEGVSAVGGLEAAFSPVRDQCGAREQSGVSVWTFERPTGPAGGLVTATFDNDVQSAVLIVAQYETPDGSTIDGATGSNRDGGACNTGMGGIFDDDESYALTVGLAGQGLVVGAVSLREHDHENGSIPEVLEVHSGTSGGDSGAVLLEAPAAGAPMELSGDFVGLGNGPAGSDLGNDWGAVAFQLR